ncbi:hypothetical protein [Streptomyces sp. TRM75561]|uniref:hypothetical protein n=1 Tax=Streptomyces sp. TRM75561 TaxID=2975269 RepID=UPI0032660B6D
MPTLRLTPARGIRTALLLCLCAVAALLFTAPQARAPSDDPVTAQASYLAEHLRENPVHVTDQLPRVVPRSTAPDVTRSAVRGSGHGGPGTQVRDAHAATAGALT